MANSALTKKQAKAILAQMKSKNLCYEDLWAEYYTGIATSYSWDADRQKFMMTEADIVAASFSRTRTLSEKSLIRILIESASAQELQEQGFCVPVCFGKED